jgi:choice-of-anchor B domain-containing protein
MKLNLFFLCLFTLGSSVFVKAQIADFNATELSNLSYTQDLNDIWGYVDNTGTEYALVGTQTGTSIVSLANPNSPSEVLFIPGATSIWRDLKTWGDFAYVTCDQGQDGLLIIDLSPLPSGTPTYQFWRPELSFNGDTDTLKKAHNLYIDENGYCYIAGSNINAGETFILDVQSTPGSPVFTDATLAIYAHDAYARGDTLWTSDINDGTFSVYDVSNKNNISFLANQTTPRDFCHNAWISDDGNSLFTTDEKSGAWIGSYDVSDMGNITEIDRWRTPNANTIPHNVHTHNDYLVISYYTDGLIILDASRPDNLIEVGRYDTYSDQPETGFYGAWGAYPYTPSGNIYISDINTGLYVLQPNYQRACWLEGLVTNQQSGANLFDVQVNILNHPQEDNTSLNGLYKTGTGVSGNYSVEYKKAGYIPQILNITLSNGVVTTQNVQLVPAVAFTVSGQVVDSIDQNIGIANAQIRLTSSMYDYTVSADANGNFSTVIFPDNDYEIIAGNWGNHARLFNVDASDSSTVPTIILPLLKGYKDEFVLDYGWIESGNATTGKWERGIPENVSSWQGTVLPDEGDIGGDIGDYCLITGNNGNGQHGVDDIDNGYTTIMSPAMDLTTYGDPYLNFHYFMNVNWPPSTQDSFVVFMTNGTTVATLMYTTTPNYEWSANQRIRIKDYLTISSNMRVFFKGNDDSQTAMEILVDWFEITDTSTTANLVLQESDLHLKYYPNPFNRQINIEYTSKPTTTRRYRVFNSLGQSIEGGALHSASGTLTLGQTWDSGLYIVEIGQKRLKIIKQ